jgi:hypothetical protein
MFTVQKVGDLENCKWYAALRDKTKSMGQRGYPRNTERNPFKDDAEMLEWYGLQPQDVCWKSELQVGVENASPRVHEKLFSYEDVCRAMQGEHNATYWAQRVLYRLQAMVESK